MGQAAKNSTFMILLFMGTFIILMMLIREKINNKRKNKELFLDTRFKGERVVIFAKISHNQEDFLLRRNEIQENIEQKFLKNLLKNLMILKKLNP